MDLIAACRVFVSVGERGSVTLGAAAARVPQSVASRRITALERHFDARLFDRTGRRLTLTPFGRAMLPWARRLVRLTEAMEVDAEQAKLRPLGVAVPETCSVGHLARLDAAARADGAVLEFRAAGPGERAELLRSLEVRVALLAVEPAEADWTVPLGAACADEEPGTTAVPQAPLPLRTLRPARTKGWRRLWIQPEDDVPHVRDRLAHLGHRAALLPAQIAVASSATAAVAATLCGDDLLLCSAAQARELGMRWQPIAGEPANRGYTASAPSAEDAARLRDGLWEQVARALGAVARPPGPAAVPGDARHRGRGDHRASGRRTAGRVGMNDARLLSRLRRDLDDAGLTGSFLVRDLATGEQIGLDPDLDLPVASLVKVPLALAVLEGRRQGHIDGARAIDIRPGPGAGGGIGLGRFRHPARATVDDLLYLSVAVSDNTAADALFDLVPPAAVRLALRDAGVTGIAVRHRMRDLTETPAERFDPDQAHLAHALAIGSRTAGHGHPVPQLDVSRANTGSARAFVDLLQALWTPSRIAGEVAGRLRWLLHANVMRQRLAPDFASDAAAWASKTGTLLNLRHEVGVVEHDDGGVLAVAALTESRAPAVTQPAAEAVMAQVARALHDHLRGR